MCGVFPVPPIVILPTEIMGMLYFLLFRIPQSKRRLRTCIIQPYIQDTGFSHVCVLISSPSIVRYFVKVMVVVVAGGGEKYPVGADSKAVQNRFLDTFVLRM